MAVPLVVSTIQAASAPIERHRRAGLQRLACPLFAREIFALSNGLGFLNINSPSLGYPDRYPPLLVLGKLENPADSVCQRYVEPIRCLRLKGIPMREKVDVGFCRVIDLWACRFVGGHDDSLRIRRCCAHGRNESVQYRSLQNRRLPPSRSPCARPRPASPLPATLIAASTFWSSSRGRAIIRCSQRRLLILLTAMRYWRAGSISNRLIAAAIASFSVLATTVPRCSARLRIKSTRQRAISGTLCRSSSAV